MLAPFPVARGLVVDPSEEVEVVERDLLRLYPQLVVKLATGGVLDAGDGVGEVGARLGGHAEGVRAAGVGPHVGEGDLFRGALLEEQLVLVVEEEDGEGSVEEALVDVGHEMACRAGVSLSSCTARGPARTELLAGSANGHVVLVGHNADLVHEPDLLLIVALERIPARVNVGEKAENRLGGDRGAGLGDCGRHLGRLRCWACRDSKIEVPEGCWAELLHWRSAEAKGGGGLGRGQKPESYRLSKLACGLAQKCTEC